MEKISSLNFSFDRVLVQLVIPGLIASFPWFLLFLHSHANAKSYFQNNASITLSTLILVSIIAGLILENLGGRIEVSYYDSIQSKADNRYSETWDKFLTLQYPGEEPVGQRYLRNILLRMKFELSAGLGIIFMMIGFSFLQKYVVIISSPILNACILYLLPSVIAVYLIMVEGKSSSKILAKTRRILVDKYYN